MPYSRVNWVDAPSTSTPISAANLNIMDAYIASLDTGVLWKATGGTVSGNMVFSGTLAATNASVALGDKMGGTDVGLNVSSGSAVLGGASVYLKQNTYWDGTNDRFTANGNAYQFNPTAGAAGNVPAWRFAVGGTAGTVISWSAWLGLTLMRSAGGGSAGSGVWVGTADPGTSANEGDAWLVG